MKKASRILLIVGKVFSIVSAVIYFLYGCFMIIASIFVGGIPADYAEVITILGYEIPIDSILSGFVLGMYLFMGIIFVAFGVLSIISTKVINKALNSPEKSNYIKSIVFSAIIGVSPSVLGGIFGLIILSKENKAKEKNGEEITKIEVEDNKEEPLF